MAKSTNNIVTHGLSGKVDLIVFRQLHGQTIVSKTPRSLGPPSDAQIEIRSRFKEAAMYAKAAIANAALKLFYNSKARGGQSAYNAAMGDFFKKPEIGEVDTSAYNGSIGSRIVVPVTDDGKVVSVKMTIQKGNGSLVEEGDATLHANGLHWEFTATTLNDSVSGSLLTITATDIPGNSSSKQKNL
jgi:hypothetical protein